MKNEIGRKITSLTLMTIMIAGGMTFAVPGMMPAAHAANANLFVSAENSQNDNYMSGPQVIEVVIIDSDINDTDEAKGEPDVTVNGKNLRMVQAVDGNWYGYFADFSQAQIADATASAGLIPPPVGVGLDFGTFCNSDTGILFGTDPIDVGDAEAIAIPSEDGSEGTNPITEGIDLSDCAVPITAVPGIMNVLRETKDINTFGTSGQIGMDADAWPFIQLYKLTVGGNVVVQYNKGGGAQTATLTFDSVEGFAGSELDRTTYPPGAQVHATVTDLWLNVDPTDEDSWTFNAGADGFPHYQVFDENGVSQGNTFSNTDDDLGEALGDLMCEDNCILLVNPNFNGATNDVLTVQDNGDSQIVADTGDLEDPLDQRTSGIIGFFLGEVPVTITEQGPNSGVFGTYDESDVSALRITNDAKRGTSATIDYNETPVSILVANSFASIAMILDDDEWNSGEEITLQLVDGDANQNSRADEDLDLFNPDVKLIPALRTGDPFTLAENNAGDLVPLEGFFADLDIADAEDVAVSGDLDPGTHANILVQAFSKRALLNTTPLTGVTGEVLVIDLDANGADLQQTMQANDNDSVFNLFNVDLRTFADADDVDIYIIHGPGANLADGA
ncbi:MAG TPA: hypothetical protein VMW74_08700, partial [Nitrosopumilaceae archaeon]|nr:hypothetical protein [Nitrosopumilaceae archaeon]